MISLKLKSLSMAAAFLAATVPAQTSITLDLTKPGHKVSPMLYGLMTEEINHSYDGGLYAELIQNRAFKDNPRTIPHWTPEGETKLSLDHDTAPTPALGVSLKMEGDGTLGVANDGYWGIPVWPITDYRVSLFARAATSEDIEVSIEGADGKEIYAKGTVSGVGSKWKKYELTLTTKASSPKTADARFVVRAKGGPVWLSLVSLFPPTTNNRPNGTRPDLLKLLKDMQPKFLRFPGGNYLEGNLFKERFDWKNTLGPLEDRPGHQCPWGYRSSDGLGLLEYMNWIEDMNAKPVLAVFAGYVLRRDVIEAGPELQGFVEDALNEIEYLTGSTSTKWGARRAKDGHPKPFDLQYVEVGNEDGFDETGSYEGRFAQFYDAIKKKYPKIKVISTTGGKDWLGVKFPINIRRPDLVDEHYYASTWDMMAMASKYDDYSRRGPRIFVGEWASQDVPEPWTNAGQKGPTPNLNCALADAAFMTGMERNSDIVEMSCYAPLLVNVNPGGRQWAVNLIGYDGLTSFGSPSYYAQQMFGENLGDKTIVSTDSGVPTQSNGKQTIPALFHVATMDSKTGTIYLKVVNPQSTAQTVDFDLKGVTNLRSSGTQIQLAGTDPKDMNSIADPKKIAPVTTTVSGLGSRFTRTFPPYSITVLKIETR
ncbi:MAG: carbohydrate binding domain-containing protein [Armatimonadetes bacterium]|nr:carbohydrate binding domain-containing protein [Armatimonadota bacterium]